MQLICYLSNGFPSKEKMFENAAAYIEAGCDIIEVDLPTNNPFLDGELIQQRMSAAYEMDSTLDQPIQNLLELRMLYPKQKFLLLSYEHTIEQVGINRFIGLCQAFHPEAVILVAPKNDVIRGQLMESDISVASYIPFHLPVAEVTQAKDANGFIYLQAKTTKTEVPYQTLKEVIAHLKEIGFTQKIYCGVGVSSPEDILMVKEAGADAAFVGSVILKQEAHLSEMKEYIRLLKSKAKE